MAAAMQLNTLMSNMFATGLLDDQFQQLQMLQDPSAPDFVAEVVTLFCEDGERIIGELAKLLDKPAVDFDKVDAFVHQLKGSSARCLKTLDAVRNDFYDLRSKFQTMLQLEQQVQASFYPKQ
ncbi:histidine-containing phosphotransfer protein 1 isoform X2 [Lolium perenne]|uniref:histidine-containing phosphotransfer protein 1 isoform X2 n=1 Tax=Lolium perenne TaxID=4522 RepID=UPI0021F588CF|nr:histidine-containing phosphotransfer protein 1-like isoform X2 [Lolium perenne]